MVKHGRVNIPEVLEMVKRYVDQISALDAQCYEKTDKAMILGWIRAEMTVEEFDEVLKKGVLEVILATLLAHAAAYGRIPDVERLLKEGADPNIMVRAEGTGQA